MSGLIVAEEIKEDYRGMAATWLREHGIAVWSKVTIKSTKGNFKGVLVPRGEQGDDEHIVIKLSSGYNIGLHINNILEIKASSQIKVDYKIPEKTSEKDPEKPNVILLGTGGTVASKIDYRTGAVIPAFTSQELFNAVPELQNLCNLDTKTVFQLFSENIKPGDWVKLANEIVNSIDKMDPIGVVVAHGTDTLHFTSAALSFMLKNLGRPVVLVGSQRSSDRPSSDAAINLINGVTVAVYSDIAEVVVCMHGMSGDEYNLIHRGTRVRKMHTSRRDAFRTIGELPLAKVEKGKVVPTGEPYKKRDQKKVRLEADTKINENVGLIYFYPGMKEELIDFFIDRQYNGLVIAGTGLGHIDQKLISSIERAREENIPIFMTSQCLWGFTGMNVYETGRMLQKAGVIPLGNMLPEVAFVKAMWVLGHVNEIPFVRKLMLENLAGELTEGEPFDGYLILQSLNQREK